MIWPVTDWQTIWEDECLVYREFVDPTTGNSLGYQLIPGPGEAGQHPCKAFISPYFDRYSSPAGQAKQDDIFQANRLELSYTADLEDQDLVFISPAVGDPAWFAVDGQVQVRERLGYAKVRIVPPGCPESGPIIYEG